MIIVLFGLSGIIGLGIALAEVSISAFLYYMGALLVISGFMFGMMDKWMGAPFFAGTLVCVICAIEKGLYWLLFAPLVVFAVCFLASRINFWTGYKFDHWRDKLRWNRDVRREAQWKAEARRKQGYEN